MKIPNGFIKESDGTYRRGSYIFDGHKIIKESTLLPTDEQREALIQTKYETLDDCIRGAIQYSSDVGQTLRTKDIYVDLVKEGEYSISEKQSNKTVAIITPDNNVYELKLTEITNQDDTKELKLDDKDNAEAPKEVKDLNTEPKELEDLKESADTKWKLEIIANGELTYYGRMTADNIDKVIALANSFEPNQAFAESEKEITEADDETPEESKQEIKPLDSAYFIRRPNNIDELQDKINKHLVQAATYSVVDEVSLSQEEFDDYANNLRQDKQFLKTFRPEPSNADFTCIAVKSPDGKTLLVDNSGYDSAQYVSII